ncbi:MAG TPA: hypothetical protein VFG68_08215 [Fimbriiglobus sp.]|nr:hypothetical protein [Fimbriiglobus sp.]
MSSDPLPTYAPDRPARFRWVPPLGLGIAVGGLIGCLATFAILELGKRSRATELVAQQFNISNVINAVPGAAPGNVTSSMDETTDLGRSEGRRAEASAVHRRMLITGWLPKGTDAGAFAHQFAAQIGAELDRLGASRSGGSTLSSSDNTSAKEVREIKYYTRDGRRGYLRLDLIVRASYVVEGTLVLTEGR